MRNKKITYPALDILHKTVDNLQLRKKPVVQEQAHRLERRWQHPFHSKPNQIKN